MKRSELVRETTKNIVFYFDHLDRDVITWEERMNRINLILANLILDMEKKNVN